MPVSRSRETSCRAVYTIPLSLEYYSRTDKRLIYDVMEATNAYMRASESLEDRVGVDGDSEVLAIVSPEFIQGPYRGVRDELEDDRGSFNDLFALGLCFPPLTFPRGNVYFCACAFWNDPYSYSGQLDEDSPHICVIRVVNLLAR